MRALRGEISAVGAAMLVIVCLLAATGCAALAGAKAALTGEEIVLARGRSARNRPWTLTASDNPGKRRALRAHSPQSPHPHPSVTDDCTSHTPPTAE